MAGLVPAIYVSVIARIFKARMPATSAGVTVLI
jgi:hypothetical protein